MPRNLGLLVDAYLDAADAAKDDRSLSAVTRNFLAFVVRRHRRSIRSIVDVVERRRQQQQHLRSVRLRTASAVSGAQRQSLDRLGSVAATVEPAVIGGAVVQIDDLRVDTTVRTGLRRLRQQLRKGTFA